jgi:glycosyltransferase involved in cell wall biosynthesis
MQSSPVVSVLLPVRNGMPFVVDAIQSVLDQSFSNFEVVVINDGSDDGTRAFLEKINDKRVKIIDTMGIGLVGALNLGLNQCCGKYIARMDADDICMPGRFSTQVSLLENDLTIGVVCTDIERINEQGCVIGEEKSLIIDNNQLRDGLTCKQQLKPIVHPSVMMRADILREVGGYRNYHSAEDRDLWLRLVDRCKFHRISTPLLKYRLTTSGISRTQREKQTASALLAVFNYLLHKKTHVDLYIMYPSVWYDFNRVFINYAYHQTKAVMAFEKTKKMVRQRKYWVACWGVMKQLFDCPNYYFPQLRRKSDNLFITKMLELATTFFAAIDELPSDLVSSCMDNSLVL